MKEREMPTVTVNWDGGEVQLTWKSSLSMLNRKYLTSAHGFCFHNQQLLLVQIPNRGWDIPGGHLEVGESPLDCVNREMLEEGYVKGNCFPLGYIVVDHTNNCNWNEKRKYPKKGYQAFFLMNVTEELRFAGENESSHRKWIEYHHFKQQFAQWNELYQAILDYAIEKYQL